MWQYQDRYLDRYLASDSTSVHLPQEKKIGTMRKLLDCNLFIMGLHIIVKNLETTWKSKNKLIKLYSHAIE